MSRGSTLAAVVLVILSNWQVFEERCVEESTDTAGSVERALIVAHAGDVALALADGLRDETHEAGQERAEKSGVKWHVYHGSRLAT